MNSNKGGTIDRFGLMACDTEWETEPKSFQASIVHAFLSASCRNDFHWNTYFLAHVRMCALQWIAYTLWKWVGMRHRWL